MLSESNPKWQEFVDELERTGQKLRTNPDGDVGVYGLVRIELLMSGRSCSKELHTTILLFQTVEDV